MCTTGCTFMAGKPFIHPNVCMEPGVHNFIFCVIHETPSKVLPLQDTSRLLIFSSARAPRSCYADSLQLLVSLGSGISNLPISLSPLSSQFNLTHQSSIVVFMPPLFLLVSPHHLLWFTFLWFWFLLPHQHFISLFVVFGINYILFHSSSLCSVCIPGSNFLHLPFSISTVFVTGPFLGFVRSALPLLVEIICCIFNLTKY